MPEPPPPKVTSVQPASVGPLCPGAIAEFKATTSPPGHIVTWKVAVNGGQPHEVQGNGNTLQVGGSDGDTSVVTASLPESNSISATAKWKVAHLEIHVPPGPGPNGMYLITDEPKMPIIPAAAVGVGGGVSISGNWAIHVDFVANDCPPFGPPDLRTHLQVSQAGGDQISFSADKIRGGGWNFRVNGTVNGCSVSASGGGDIGGTNPQLAAIRNALPLETRGALLRIACKESGQRQFNAPPYGGTAWCPLFGQGGKVGMLQIANPTEDEV